MTGSSRSALVGAVAAIARAPPILIRDAERPFGRASVAPPPSTVKEPFVLSTACRVRSALALDVIARIADVLPYIGVFLSVGPAVAAAASRRLAVVLIVLAAKQDSAAGKTRTLTAFLPPRSRLAETLNFYHPYST